MPFCRGGSADFLTFTAAHTPIGVAAMGKLTGGVRVRSSHRFALVGLTALGMLAAGCSTSGSSGSSGGTNWSTVSSASAGGGMSALISAAKKEGKLNVIALPPTWANYGTIIKTFEQKYGIKVNSANPDGSSQDEVNAVKQENGTAAAPDVWTSAWRSRWSTPACSRPTRSAPGLTIPAAQKDTGGLWYQDYGGYMSVGYSSKFGTITSLSQLLGSKFKNAVALNGNPTEANAALNGVMMASLANGGSAGSIAKGVSFFQQLKMPRATSPRCRPPRPRSRRAPRRWCSTGTTSTCPVTSAVSNWKVFIPSGAVLGGYYAQAINKNAPDPAAARLWEEFLYSQAADGGQNLWLAGGARPVEQPAMTSNSTINTGAAAKLPRSPARRCS